MEMSQVNTKYTFFRNIFIFVYLLAFLNERLTVNSLVSHDISLPGGEGGVYTVYVQIRPHIKNLNTSMKDNLCTGQNESHL